MDVDEKKEFIFGQVGSEALAVLREEGIDIDEAVTRLLEEQAQKQTRLGTMANSGQLSDMMTSELVYRSASSEDVYGQEFTRRLKSIGLADKQVTSLYQMESLIGSVDGLKQQRDEPWVRRYFFINGISTPDNIPKKGQLTLSELILITDDASSAWARDHEVLSEETWAAVSIAAVQAVSLGGAQYAFCLNERVQKLGWSPEQEGAFIRNESMLTERLKWGSHKRPAWTAETTNLAEYKG